MRLARLDKGIENKKLAITIKSRDGNKLIGEGAILSARIINRLKNSGFSAVYIEDDNFDIQLQETVDVNKRARMYSKIQEIFADIEKNEFNSIELLRFIRLELLPEINNEPISISYDEVVEKEDLVQHSINVTILAVRTAALLGFNAEKIELMAFISLMHDIGKLIKNNDPKLKNIPHYKVAFEFMKRKNCTVLSYMSVRFQEESYDGNGAFKIDKDKQLDLVKVLSKHLRFL